MVCRYDFKTNGAVILAVLFVFFTVLMGFTVVSAAVDSVLFVEDPNIGGVCSALHDETGVDILRYSSSDSLLRFSNDLYKNLKDSDKQGYMEIALNYVRNSSISEANRLKVYNFIADQDTAVANVVKRFSSNYKADVALAWAYLNWLTPGVRLALGILMWVIVGTMMLRLVVDIVYLADLPLVHWLLGRDGEVGKDKKPLFITRTAWNIYEDFVDKGGEKGTSGMVWDYVKQTVFAMFFLSIAVYLLVSGDIFKILIFVTELVHDIFGTLV